MEDAGIYEAFFDISHIDKPAKEIAKEIKKITLNDTGLIYFIGIAPPINSLQRWPPIRINRMRSR